MSPVHLWHFAPWVYLVWLPEFAKRGYPISSDPATTRGQFSWSLLRYAVAALLLLAAVVKVVQTPQILAADGLLSSGPRLTSAIAFEAAAATFLAVAPPVWSWMLTLITFFGFIVASVYAIVTGQSCGCLGEQLPPEAMLIIDIAVLVLSLLYRPDRAAVPKMPTMESLVVCLLVGLGVAGASIVRQNSTDHSDPLEFLLADQLTGQPWPLNDLWHEDLSALQHDNWVVVVIRRDCDHCRKLVERFFADPATHRPGERTAVFVAGSDVWPFALDYVGFDVSQRTCIEWLDGEPFVASPAVFLVSDGVVVQAADGKNSESLLESLQGLPH